MVTSVSSLGCVWAIPASQHHGEVLSDNARARWRRGTSPMGRSALKFDITRMEPRAGDLTKRGAARATRREKNMDASTAAADSEPPFLTLWSEKNAQLSARLQYKNARKGSKTRCSAAALHLRDIKVERRTDGLQYRSSIRLVGLGCCPSAARGALRGRMGPSRQLNRGRMIQRSGDTTDV